MQLIKRLLFERLIILDLGSLISNPLEPANSPTTGHKVGKHRIQGISSGANFLGALLVQNKLDSNAVVVTVFADDNKKYLSTDLMKTEPVKHDFLAPHIELLSSKAFKRVCHTCCKPEECLHSISKKITLPPCPVREA